MFDALIGVTVGFILLAIGLGWIIARSKGDLAVKMAMIVVLIYYGLSVFYTVPNLMGWGVEKELPYDAKIINIRILEPKGEREGWIWFLLNEKPDLKSDIMNLLDPKKVFIYTGAIQPRLYKVPYDEELHRKIIEMMKKKKRMQGSVMATSGERARKKKKGKGGYPYDTENLIKILNPRDILRKPDAD